MNSMMKKPYPGKKLWPMLFSLATMICLFSTTTYGDDKKMEPLYDLKEAATIEPQVYKIGMASSLSLFPVPQDNAVGTNDMNNAITVFSFPDGNLRDDRYFRNDVSDIEGGGTYLPVISKDMIGFGQSRRFLLYNFKTKKHEVYRIVFSLDKTVEKIAIADAARKRFIFEIEAMNSKSEDYHDNTYILQLIDLSEGKVKLIKEIDIGKGSIWAAAYNRVFLWYFSKEEMRVYDMNLEPSQHPLEDIIKQNKGKIKFTRLAPHPSLPFAIIYGGGDMPDTLLIWREGSDKKPVPLLKSGMDDVSFSPDGKWVAFKDDSTDPARTYLMPVSEKYPNFLGTPILLRKRPFSSDTFAWTNNPVSLVGNDGEFIFRWELTKEAQKIEEKEYPTFHDYIVAKDLEKLTKEKKQGLGQK